jgi:UDP-N-acetyl-D-glucosamine dehydrogenase
MILKEIPLSKLCTKLFQTIENYTARVGIIGLGYVGLPLADAIAAAGYTVFGFDIDKEKIDKLKGGESYIGHISRERIVELMRTNRFDATSDPSCFANVDVIIICVPTPLNDYREPDLSYIESTGRMIRAQLRPGQLVVLESTTYPGTTESLLRPILEESGLKAGVDFFLAFAPEREDPGNPQFGTRSIPKVIGGINTNSRDLTVALYEKVMAQVVRVSSTGVAEACKILENTYRAVNIALVNELKILFDAMGIDIWEVIEAAQTKPFGFQAFYPGPGLGGHCIPIDPFYLTWVARKYGMATRFIELAGEINTAMPKYVVQRVADALNERSQAIKGSKVAVLGVAYKKNINDPRESPAFTIIKLLQQRGAEVCYNDPHIPTLPEMRHHSIQLDSQPLTREFLQGQDCVLIVTDHAAYDVAWIVENSRLIVDTRNATSGCDPNGCTIRKA